MCGRPRAVAQGSRGGAESGFGIKSQPRHPVLTCYLPCSSLSLHLQNGFRGWVQGSGAGGGTGVRGRVGAREADLVTSTPEVCV